MEIRQSPTASPKSRADRGIGLTTADIAEMFEPFYRAERRETAHPGWASAWLYARRPSAKWEEWSLASLAWAAVGLLVHPANCRPPSMPSGRRQVPSCEALLFEDAPMPPTIRRKRPGETQFEAPARCLRDV